MEDKKNKHPKVGLALSGGSALGIAHIGVIKCLMEHNIPIDCVAGTSAGAIAAVCVAFDVPIPKMIEMSKGLSWTNISEFGHSKMGLNSNRPMGEIIEDMVGYHAKIEDAHIPLAIIATNIDTGEEVVFHKGDVAEAVMASTCLPAFFVPVKARRRKLVDGGLVENLPLSPLKNMGAQIKIGVDLSRFRTYKKAHNIIDVITNSYSILTKPQSAIAPGQVDVLIEPHLEKFNTSDFGKVNELMEEGHRAAELMMPQIKKLMAGSACEKKGFFQKIICFFKGKNADE
jgi:NTE family protein